MTVIDHRSKTRLKHIKTIKIRFFLAVSTYTFVELSVNIFFFPFFQELLLEQAELFYHVKSIAPTGTITQEDIREITQTLQEDSRYDNHTAFYLLIRIIMVWRVVRT